MAYKPLYGRVAPDAKVPLDDDIDTSKPSGNQGSLLTLQKCPHGFMLQSACWRCEELKKAPALPFPKVVSERSVVSPSAEMKPDNPNPSLFEDIHPYSPIIVGSHVVRRIRPEVVGRVTQLEHVFTDTKALKQVWVLYEGRSAATPYAPTELLRVRMQ